MIVDVVVVVGLVFCVIIGVWVGVVDEVVCEICFCFWIVELFYFFGCD